MNLLAPSMPAGPAGARSRWFGTGQQSGNPAQRMRQTAISARWWEIWPATVAPAKVPGRMRPGRSNARIWHRHRTVRVVSANARQRSEQDRRQKYPAPDGTCCGAMPACSKTNTSAGHQLDTSRSYTPLLAPTPDRQARIQHGRMAAFPARRAACGGHQADWARAWSATQPPPVITQSSG